MTDKELSMKFVLNYPKIEKGELLTTMDLQNAYLAGLKAGRQGQSGIGWIDTAHIEVKLHDAVMNM